ncbi:hypothetical protein AB1Y20_001626 [Prymnesium parvum]|uniref:Uncharacterized protein n=1 Tax=Prymnesium parvum TaxID=97485 RepID=A0AB34KBN1_PRYPA
MQAVAILWVCAEKPDRRRGPTVRDILTPRVGAVLRRTGMLMIVQGEPSPPFVIKPVELTDKHTGPLNISCVLHSSHSTMQIALIDDFQPLFSSCRRRSARGSLEVAERQAELVVESQVDEVGAFPAADSAVPGEEGRAAAKEEMGMLVE